MFGTIVLGLLHRVQKQISHWYFRRPPTCRLCGKLHRTCIADIGWCLTFVSALPIGYDPRAEDLRKHVPPAPHSTPVRDFSRTTPRFSQHLCAYTAAYRHIGSSYHLRPLPVSVVTTKICQARKHNHTEEDSLVQVTAGKVQSNLSNSLSSSESSTGATVSNVCCQATLTGLIPQRLRPTLFQSS